MHEFYKAYFQRLTELHQGINAAVDGLSQEAIDWQPGQVMNSLGVLAAHAAGAERYWIGDVAGQQPSGRIREQEFKAKNKTAAEVQALFEKTLQHSYQVLQNLTLFELKEMRLSARDGHFYSVAWALNHALEHTGIHLGHMQIGRELWEQR